MGWTSGVEIPVGPRDYPFLKPSTLVLGPTQPSIWWVQGSFLPIGVMLPGLNIGHPLHLVSRLRMSGDTQLFPLHIFKTWTGTTSVLHVYSEKLSSKYLFFWKLSAWEIYFEPKWISTHTFQFLTSLGEIWYMRPSPISVGQVWVNICAVTAIWMKST